MDASKAVSLGQDISSLISLTIIKLDPMNGCFQGRLLGPELFNINCNACIAVIKFEVLMVVSKVMFLVLVIMSNEV